MNNDWIEWTGGASCPVDRDALVSVKFRPVETWGETEPQECMKPMRAGSCFWFHDGSGGDILAYRVVG